MGSVRLNKYESCAIVPRAILMALSSLAFAPNCVTAKWILGNVNAKLTFDEFYDYVECGGFIDYDGQGVFIDNTTAEEIKGVRCNCEWLKKNKPENSDYIMWFNK